MLLPHSGCSDPCLVLPINIYISAEMGSVPLGLSDLQHQIAHGLVRNALARFGASGEEPRPKNLVPRASAP